MGLIVGIVSGAGTILGGVVAKVIADDAKEWTPRVTRRLLHIAVLRLPEGQRECSIPCRRPGALAQRRLAGIRERGA